MLNFHCDHVQPQTEVDHGVGVLEVALDKPGREMSARRLLTWVHDLHTNVPIQGFLDHHATELASTQDAHPELGPQGGAGFS